MADVSKITVPNGTSYDLKDAAARSKLDYTNIAHCTCATAAATAAKVVTVVGNPDWKLNAGAIIGVKFTNSNTASSVTLNVNGTGAKSIYYNNAVYTSTSNIICGVANRTNYYMYDGTYWVFLHNGIVNSDTYPSAYCSTGAGTAAKVATCSGYVLLAKSFLHIIVTNANTSQGAITLNVNSRGAKPIYINGAASSASNYTLPAGSYIIYYDGTNYYFRTDGKLTADVTGTASNVTGTVAVANGGTGKTTGADAANFFINSLSEDTSTPTDSDYYVAQYAGGGTSTTTYHRRPLSALWTWIKGKITKTVITDALGYTPPTADTHYTTHLYAGSGTAANAATTNGNTKVSVVDNSTVRDSVTIKGTGATTVTSDATGVISIGSTNTTYTFASGDANGQIKVTPSGGTAQNVSVKGLGTAAYKKSHSVGSLKTDDIWSDSIPAVGSDGVIELGKYIDFHVTKGETKDYDVRITANTTGLTLGGTTVGTFSGDLSGNATSASALQHLTLNSTTINNTAGTFAFSGSGDPWSGTDWVGLQVGDGVDKFQITANNSTLLMRQNDSGGTNSTGWSSWLPMAKFSATPTSGQVIVADGTSGFVKSSGYTIAKSVPADAKFTDTTYTAASATPANIGTAAVGTSAKYAREDHVHAIALATGDSNGQVKIAGTNVSVKGLGTAAYTASTAYATASHTHNYAGSSSAGGTANGVAGQAGTNNSYRHVWFSDGGTETTRNYDDDFKYNPSTNSMQIAKAYMTYNATTASLDFTFA